LKHLPGILIGGQAFVSHFSRLPRIPKMSSKRMLKDLVEKEFKQIEKILDEKVKKGIRYFQVKVCPHKIKISG
jgi:hypothetical protein